MRMGPPPSIARSALPAKPVPRIPLAGRPVSQPDWHAPLDTAATVLDHSPALTVIFSPPHNIWCERRPASRTETDAAHARTEGMAMQLGYRAAVTHCIGALAFGFLLLTGAP